MLIVFGGLPGTGKTTLSRALARDLNAIHVRIDTIEQAIMKSAMAPPSMDDAGYLVGYAVAEDNLLLGRTVIADSVNPLQLTRDAWRDVAKRAGVDAFEIEIICSDADTHRHRIETRGSDLAGQKLLTWNEVVTRDYQLWHSAPLVIDTAVDSVDQSLAIIHAALGSE